ncbi:LysR family transcriptional regulator [Kiloniella laminariae]|uniref:LysR family transcriptional regulator n=1 Tax=Kiloniella laminariae TaxID=454162 RepID=A0ABT4LDN2_9PROT|nr:LysR family transcriptional regulator [Kiloniella laminariae]MCZ4279201.1 LysR family transcriptional regulator [Kiloniella laminariae]
MTDWDDYRYFQAVVTQGSFSAAARALDVTQPTIGRRIGALEARLGQELFERDGKYVRLTGYGRLLAQRIEPMVASAGRLERELEGFGDSLLPPVRLTSTDGLALYWLPEVLADFHLNEPDIPYLLTPGNNFEDVARREVDIAFRTGGGATTGLLEVPLLELEYGLWASETYLERRGRPASATDLEDHLLIAFSERYMGLDTMQLFRPEQLAKNIVFRSDNVAVQARAAQAGLGIAFLPDYLAVQQEKLIRIPWPSALVSTGITMLAHPSALESPSISKVWNYLLSLRGKLTIAHA